MKIFNKVTEFNAFLFKASALSVFATSLLSPLWARAEGGVSGGGGNAVVCFANHPEIPQKIRSNSGKHAGELLDEYIPFVSSVETYDLQQARLEQGWDPKAKKLAEIRDGETPEDYLDRLANQYEKTLPEVALLVRTANHLFSERNILQQPGGLIKVDDSSEMSRIGDNTHCVLATLAVNYFNKSALPVLFPEFKNVRTSDGRPFVNFGETFHLDYDGRLLNLVDKKSTVRVMSPMSRAVLRLHEGLYALARAYEGATDSRNTRDLVRILITSDQSLNIESLIHSLKDLGFSNVVLLLSDMRSYESLHPIYLEREFQKLFDLLTEQVRVSAQSGYDPKLLSWCGLGQSSRRNFCYNYDRYGSSKTAILTHVFNFDKLINAAVQTALKSSLRSQANELSKRVQCPDLEILFEAELRNYLKLLSVAARSDLVRSKSFDNIKLGGFEYKIVEPVLEKIREVCPAAVRD